ncbi:DNA cytosine methyltransferase [Desulfuribacillus alkaliarsenatis]|uniref:Cytosine-specific methyltransferase n=1 Tax=Desulfuribacillus alkaliarsenatis TaxID=766136 RepID=A0A1E5G272_9FIRM|nr:DNA cytosine methyltransferase [Desulfuribacillus alkaliarsenatis]OEF97003.1 DNA (cytosine-5-)-methyltransferase [Desulfuribacillus alkaliarsenatis]
MKYRTIDLFAGIGGIRRGFEMTGHFENVLSAEIDRYACMTYKHLYGQDPFNDVTSATFKNQLANISYDVLLGGFPCQAFSIAGKKEGFKDKTRGTLFYDIAEIIEMTRPKAFLIENVEGLLRHQKGETFKVILETLVNDLQYKVVGVSTNPITNELEYNPKSFILNSKNFGVPQNRPRVYILGYDKRRYGESSSLDAIALPQKNNRFPIYRNLHDLLEYGADPEYYLSSGYLETLKRHKARHKGKGNGFGYMVVNAKNIENPISNAVLATGGSGKERNLVYDPQEGIAGLLVKSKKTPLNGEGIRQMTPGEWGRLQGFVDYAFKDFQTGIDEFSFPQGVSKAQQYKQFGNSVTIPVIETIAASMYDVLYELEVNLSEAIDNLQNKSLSKIV